MNHLATRIPSLERAGSTLHSQDSVLQPLVVSMHSGVVIAAAGPTLSIKRRSILSPVTPAYNDYFSRIWKRGLVSTMTFSSAVIT